MRKITTDIPVSLKLALNLVFLLPGPLSGHGHLAPNRTRQQTILSAARPIVGTQAELIFVSAHCPGRLRVPGRSEELARISHSTW